MTTIDHVTYHVPEGTLADPRLSDFMCLLGLVEVEPRDPFEHDWNVRWWRSSSGVFRLGAVSETRVHLVEGVAEGFGDCDALALGHFCVRVGAARFETLQKCSYLVRDSGSGRIWLGVSNLRVEVRR